MTFCEEVRKECDDFWQGSFEHPFVKGIADGTLPLDVFRFYVKQDSYYLSHFAKIQSLGAAKAPNLATTKAFAEHALATCEAELSLHELFMNMLGVTDQELTEFQPSPTAYAYVSHMYRCAFTGDLADLLAGLLPCYWLYFEIGERLKDAKPDQPIYDRWIQTYGSEWFAEKVKEQINRMNELAEGLSPARRTELKEHFRKSSYYEWNFWDMAWRQEEWLIKDYSVAKERV